MSAIELRRRVALALSRHLKTLRLESFLRYSWWRLRGNRTDIDVTLRDGTRVALRAGSEDFFIASEIFFDKQYEPPVPLPLEHYRTVVDVGANVGYSCLWFARACPEAHILAFEPLAEHVAQVHRNLLANDLEGRVQLVAAAATPAASELMLVPAGAQTRVVAAGSPSAVPTSTVDWFAHLPDGPLDLIKMDIEGGERALLADPRFERVAERVQCLVVEWHDPERGHEEKRRCRERMVQTGFDVVEGADYGVAGLLWGLRGATAVGLASAP